MDDARQLDRLSTERRSNRRGLGKKRGPRPKLDTAALAALVEDWRAGLAVDEIRQRYKIAESTLYRALRRAARERLITDQPTSADPPNPAPAAE